MNAVPASASTDPEIAFYYPGPFWSSAAQMKNLLLFFDGLALLVPSYMRKRPEELEPEMVLPLTEKGLLTLIEPETAVDKEATERLATSLTDIIVSGALDSLASHDSQFHELSWSRLGGYGDEGLARMIHDELKARGLAKDSVDGYSVPMHPLVRSLVLVLLAQILRPYGAAHHLDLSPVTDRPQILGALQELLSLHGSPAAGQIVTLDLQAVGVDLAKVPLDDVLSFRSQHLPAFRQYSASVRRFVRDLSLVPAPERPRELKARQEELEALAKQLQASSKKVWKKAAKFALGISGAAWSAHTGNPVGVALGIGGAILGWDKSKTETGAYSYIFRARDTYA